MTITNKDTARQLLTDPSIVRLYEYTNLLNQLTMWAAFEKAEHDDTNVSPFVTNRILLKHEDVRFARLSGLTGYGFRFGKGEDK